MSRLNELRKKYNTKSTVESTPRLTALRAKYSSAETAENKAVSGLTPSTIAPGRSTTILGGLNLSDTLRSGTSAPKVTDLVEGNMTLPGLELQHKQAQKKIGDLTAGNKARAKTPEYQDALYTYNTINHLREINGTDEAAQEQERRLLESTGFQSYGDLDGYINGQGQELKVAKSDRDGAASAYYTMSNRQLVGDIRSDKSVSAAFERAVELGQLISDYEEDQKTAIAEVRPLTATPAQKQEGEAYQANMAEYNELVGLISAAGYDAEKALAYELEQYRIQKAETAAQELTRFGQEHKVVGSLISVPLSVTQGLDYLTAAAGSVGSSDPADLESYKPLNISNFPTTTAVSGLRSGASADMGAVGKFLYDAGMSAADSALAATMFGKGATVVLGMSAASGAAKEVVERGGTNRQALISGAAAGTAEMLFEKLSIDNLVSMSKSGAWTDFLANFFKQVGIEASEEVFTEIANIISDSLIMGDNSNFKNTVEEYMAGGMTRAEAEKQAALDNLKQVALAGLAGAVSGGGTTLMYAAPQVAANNAAKTRHNRAVSGPQTAQSGGAVLNRVAGGKSSAGAETFSPHETAREEVPAGGSAPALTAEPTRLTNSQVKRMIRDKATMEEMGIDTNGKTMRELRNEVRAALASQEQATVERSAEIGMQTPAQETALKNDSAVTEEIRQMPQTERMIPIAPQTQAEYNGVTRTEGMTNGEEVYLRNGGQRAGSAYPGGQVSAVEESAGRAESGQAARQIADRGAASLTYGERVSTASLGIGGGSIKNNIRILKSGDTQYTAEAKRIAKERGLRVYFFADDNLSIRQSDGKFASVRGYISGDRVFIRADHPLYTADQIMRHEAGHDMIAKGEVDIADVKKRIVKAVGRGQTRRVSKAYADAYTGSGMTAEEIWEEVICDSLGDMNIFAGTVNESAAGQFLDESKQAVQADAVKSGQSRAPPAADANVGNKMSVETLPDGKKYVRADRQVIFGNDPESWSEQLEDYINGKIRKGQNVQLIAEDGDVLTLTAQTAGKVASMFNNNGTTMSEKAFERKVNAGAHIDELARVSTRGDTVRPDVGGRHGEMAEGGWNYRTAYFRDFDRKYYRVRISVAIGADGNAVYNIGEMVERSFPQITGSSANGGAQEGKASSQISMPQTEREVKGKFSRELDTSYLSAVERGDMENVDIRFSMKPTAEFKPKRTVNHGEFLSESKRAAQADMADGRQQRRPPAGKMSRDVDREFQINFSGTVFADRGIKLSNAEKKAVSSAIKSGNAHMAEDGLMGEVTVAGRVYYFDAFDSGTAAVFRKVDAGRLNIHNNIFSAEGQYGKTGRESDQRAGYDYEGAGRTARNGQNDFGRSTPEQPADGKLDESKSERDRRSDAGEGQGDRQGLVSDTYGPDYAHWRNAMKDGKASRDVEVNAKRIDTAEVRRATKQAVSDAQLAGMMNQGRKDAEKLRKAKESAAEMRRKRDAKVRELKAQQRERAAQARERLTAKEYREKIERHVKSLSQKLLNPTDKKHIPENLRTAVAKLLEAINLESAYTLDPDTLHEATRKDGKSGGITGKHLKDGSGLPTKRTKAVQELKAAYQKILQDEGTELVIDPSMEPLFDEVSAMVDVRLADMTSEQAKKVWELIRMVESSITTAGKNLTEAKAATTAEWAEKFKRDTSTRKGRKGRVIESFRLDMENPYTFFSHFGQAGMDVYRMLRDAQDEQQVKVGKLQREIQSLVTAKEIKQIENTVHEFDTERGDHLVLTAAHVMEIYELMKREQAQEHLLKGGIVQPEIKVKGHKKPRGTNAILLSSDDLVRIAELITDEQAKIADAFQALTTGILADWGNEASMQAYGYKKFTGEDYWPIHSAGEGVHSKTENSETNTRSIKNIGLAKNTVPHASNPLDIGGLFNTFAGHAADMIDYSTWLCPMEDANRLFNYQFRDAQKKRTGKSIKGLLDSIGGKGSQTYWKRLMEDIQNGTSPSNDTTVISYINKLYGNTKAASVGANLRVVIQQPTAILKAAAVMNPLDIAAGLVRRGGWSSAVKHSPIAMRKAMGGFDVSSPMQMGETLYDNKAGLEKFNDSMMVPASVADALTWGWMWNACERAVKKGNPDLRGDEFYEAVNKKFTDLIDQSQVVDGVLQRSQIMRSGNALVKQATAFMGEPTMTANMIIRAWDQWVRETDPAKRKQAKGRFGRTLVALVATNAVNALAQSLVDAWRDDDEDKSYWERFESAFTGIEGDEESAWEKAVAFVLKGNMGQGINPAGYVPFAKDALSILQGYNVTRADADAMGDVIKAAQTAVDSFSGKGKKTIAYAVKEVANQVGKVFGVSGGNILRDVWGIMRSIAVQTGNTAVQYEMEKAIYKISNDGNYGRFADVLFRAYSDGDEMYEHIYNDMIANGIPEDKIHSLMESRMKKAQGVKSVDDLEQRYLSPEMERTYAQYHKELERSKVWKKATQEQKADSEDDIYQLLMSASSTSKEAQELQDKLENGARYGVSETEYLLYQLALSMTDKPTDSGKYGSYTNDEVKDAIDMLGLSKKESAWLWEAQGRSEKSNPYK